MLRGFFILDEREFLLAIEVVAILQNVPTATSFT